MLQKQVSTSELEAGCDEAGRGCLAGPVTAAAVILPKDFHHEWLNDSKQVNKKKRDQLREVIEREALYWSVAECSPEEIDEINILNASIKAMQKAVAALPIKPTFLAIDGNRFKSFEGIPYSTEVKGDGRFLHIAAASILAKTHRDELMFKLHQQYPEYGWDSNAGYPTVNHRLAIKEYGVTPYHRKSFRLLSEQMKLF